MRTKTATAESDALGGGGFSALVAVFNNIDSANDRILPGAFSKTLKEWRQSGDPIPVILSHQHGDAASHIGIVDPHAALETERGLLVHGQLDVDENPTARQVHRLMKRRSLKEFSFGYLVPSHAEHKAADGANEISEVSLIEVGPCLKGANPSTELLSVKAYSPSSDELRQRCIAAGLPVRSPLTQQAYDAFTAILRDR